MVVAYLEKIRNQITEQKVNLEFQLKELHVSQKENEAFLDALEQNRPMDYMEGFTPRVVNDSHNKKMEELKQKMVSLEMKIKELETDLENIEIELGEVSYIIMLAKKMR